MANSTRIYRRATTVVTIMAYLGADTGDKDEIRRIVEEDGATVEDGIAYFGTDGQRWLRERDETYRADGFEASAAPG